MNLEEHAELLRRRAKKLLDIDVDEISLVTSPAVRKSFYIKKKEQKMKDFDEVLAIVEEYLGEDVKKAKGVDAKKLLQAVSAINRFTGDLPPKLKNAISAILEWSVGKEYGYPAKKSQTDDFPSIPIAAPAHIIEKMIDRMDGEDDEGNDDDDEDDEDDDK